MFVLKPAYIIQLYSIIYLNKIFFYLLYVSWKFSIEYDVDIINIYLLTVISQKSFTILYRSCEYPARFLRLNTLNFQ